MIFDRSNIVDQFRGLIGFMPSYDVSNTDALVGDFLSTSYSGRYINELSPLFTPENFANSAPQFKSYTVAEWSAKDYKKGSVVDNSGIYYSALENVISTEVPGSSSKWQKTTLLSTWIQAKYDGAVLALIDRMMADRKLEFGNYNKELRGATALFNSEGIQSNLISKSGRFVGFEISVKQSDMAVAVQRVGMQLSENASLPIFIRYNGVETELTFNADRAPKFKYQDIPPVSVYSGNGSMIIGYYEDDLGASSAIDTKTTALNGESCKTCGGLDSAQKRIWYDWVDVKPVSILNNVQTDYTDTNFGLNLVLSFRCDLSDLIIREKVSFIDALAAQLKVTFMTELSQGMRNNQQADQTSLMATKELLDWEDPDNPKKRLSSAIKALNVDFSGLNSVCIPCTPARKFKSRII